jgi:hypothetical protein
MLRAWNAAVVAYKGILVLDELLALKFVPLSTDMACLSSQQVYI